MTSVFGHGRLRLYLLKLLDEGPKHGYELIRSLQERFHGRYTPSAGTIYPRLARMEADGLVSHTAVGGRKVYEITDAGRDELRQRSSEIEALEAEIRSLVEELSTHAAEARRGERPASPPRPRQRGESPPESTPAQGPTDAQRALLDELEQELDECAAELRSLIREARINERQLRVVTTALRSTLSSLRRLLD